MPRAPHHPLLAAVFRAQPEAEQEMTPWHLGGPQPVAPRRVYAAIAVRAAEAAASQVRDPDYQRHLAAARTMLANPTEAMASSLRPILGPYDFQDATPARLAARTTLHLAGGARNILAVATLSVFTAARTLHKWPAVELAFDIDDTLMRSEVELIFRRRKIDAVLDRVTFRGGDRRGNPEAWLVRTKTGWGALVRRQGYHWTEGERAEALAAIPDEHLEAAARSVLG